MGPRRRRKDGPQEGTEGRTPGGDEIQYEEGRGRLVDGQEGAVELGAILKEGTSGGGTVEGIAILRLEARIA